MSAWQGHSRGRARGGPIRVGPVGNGSVLVSRHRQPTGSNRPGVRRPASSGDFKPIINLS